MYYTWTGWWWFAWVIPMVLLIWATFGWTNSRRYYGTRERSVRDPYWDDAPLPPTRKLHYRNRGPRNYRRSDERITEDVNDRLMQSDEIDPSELEVRVENGEVSLLGTVETRYEKRIAERLADSVAGVKDVDNRLRIGKVNHAMPPSHFEHAAPNPPGV